MPTCHFIITNKIVESLVDAYNLYELDDYLINTIMLKDVCESYELFEMDEIEQSCPISYNEKLYHILSYATYTINLAVLKHFSDKINVEYLPDGNGYNLIDLAVENYVEKYKDNNSHINIYNTPKIYKMGYYIYGLYMFLIYFYFIFLHLCYEINKSKNNLIIRMLI